MNSVKFNKQIELKMDTLRNNDSFVQSKNCCTLVSQDFLPHKSSRKNLKTIITLRKTTINNKNLWLKCYQYFYKTY